MYKPDDIVLSPKNSSDQAPTLTTKKEKSKTGSVENPFVQGVRDKLERNLRPLITTEEGDTLYLSIGQKPSGTIKINAEKIAEKPQEGI